VPDAYLHGYATEEQARLLSQAEHWREELILAGTTLAPGTRLLEVGCGVGAVLGVLGETFPGVAFAGVDIEERQIAAARAHLTGLGVQADLRQADALKLPYADASFDHVWMMWFLEHVGDPVAALREARRVLAPGGALTAIEVGYNTVWASPTTAALEMLFSAMARGIDSAGRSDAGTRLAGWLAEAEFASVDPGARNLSYSGADLARQTAYAAALLENMLPTLAALPGVTASQLRAGLADLQALPATPGAGLGWAAHKATAFR
jgi:ubiquinone/menaquinone biosynthesis C-methylase UbiE